MAEQITLNPKLGSLFSGSAFEVLMTKNNATVIPTTTEHEKAKWVVNDIHVTLYSKSLVIQTKKDPAYYDTVKTLCSFDGVLMDTENKTKLAALSPKTHNTMLCPTCYTQSRTLTSSIESLDIVFKHECGHINNMNNPIMVLNNRILPDLNILISNSLSRLIEMGLFEGHEIVIPKFAMKVAETLGGSKKTGIHNEITKLKSLETAGKIKVMHYGRDDDTNSIEKMLSHEDEILAKISDETNSILITSDKLFQSTRQLENRPVILMPGSIHAKIKTLHEVRS